MKIKFILTADTANGEGYFSNQTIKKIEQLIFDEPLLAADILKDWLYEVGFLYEMAVEEMQKDFEGRRNSQ